MTIYVAGVKNLHTSLCPIRITTINKLRRQVLLLLETFKPIHNRLHGLIREKQSSPCVRHEVIAGVEI